MASNGDGLLVTYDGLDQAATTIGNEAKALEADLEELKQMVVKSLQYWEGEAGHLRQQAQALGQGSQGHPRRSPVSATWSVSPVVRTWMATRRLPATSSRSTGFSGNRVGACGGAHPGLFVGAVPLFQPSDVPCQGAETTPISRG